MNATQVLLAMFHFEMIFLYTKKLSKNYCNKMQYISNVFTNIEKKSS